VVVMDASYSVNFLNVYGTFAYITAQKKEQPAPIKYYPTDLSPTTTISILDLSLNIPNVALSYTIVPYSRSDVSGAYYTAQTTFRPLVTFAGLGTVTDTSMGLNLTGTYDHVQLFRNGTLVADLSGNGPFPVTPSVTSYVDVSLASNGAYVYTATPYFNSPYQVGSTLTLGTFSTLPALTAVVTNDVSNALTWGFTGNYKYMSISRNGTVIAPRAGYTVGVNNSPMVSYTDGPLAPNTAYSYTFTPYNASDVSGPLFQATATTAAFLRYVSADQVTASTVRLDISGVYHHYTVQRSDLTAFTDTCSNEFYADASANLRANTAYTYTITPYNSANQSATPTTYTATTLATLKPPLLLADTSNTLVLDISGYYNYLSITRNGVPLTSQVFPTAVNATTGQTEVSYNDVALTPNTQYEYVITPYNAAGVANPASLVDVSYTTLPMLTSLTVGSVDTSSAIQLAFTGYYHHVSVTRNGTLLTNQGIGSTYLDASSGAQALQPDMCYNYVVTPFTSGGLSGVPLTLVASTQPILTKASSRLVSAVSGSAVTGYVALDMSGAFAYTNVYRTVGSSNAGGLGTLVGTVKPTSFTNSSVTYQDTTVAGNTTYTYTLVPYASIDGSTNPVTGIAGTPAAALVVTTLPTMTVSVTGATATTVTYGFTGNYSYIVPDLSGSGAGANITGSSFQVTGASAYTVYLYTFKAFNSAGASSQTVLYPASTLPSLTSAYLQTITYFANTIGYTGNYADVQIYRNDQRGNTALIKDVSASISPWVVPSTSFVDTNPSPNTFVWYTVVPFNTEDISSASIDTSSVFMPARISIINTYITGNSISITFDGSYSYAYAYLNGVLVSKPMPYTGIAYTFTYSNLMANTTYNCELRYNGLGISMPIVLSTPLTTLPTVSRFLIANSLFLTRYSYQSILDVSGLYDHYTLTRFNSSCFAGTGTTDYKGIVNLGTFTSSVIVENNTVGDQYYVSQGDYVIYTLTPYNSSNQAGTPLTLLYKTYYYFQITDPFFYATVTSTPNLTLPNPPLTNWTATATADATYYLGGVTVFAPLNLFYTGVLPSNVNTYFVACNSPTLAYQTVTLTQDVSSSLVNPGYTYGQSYLSFYVFPGAVIDPNHSLTVSIGRTNLLYNATFGSDPTMPYIRYTLPFTMLPNDYASVTFTFTSPTASSSQICVGNIQILCPPTYEGLGIDAIDYAGFLCYYSFDKSAANGTQLVNYAKTTGTRLGLTTFGLNITDAVLMNGASIANYTSNIPTTYGSALDGTVDNYALNLVAAQQQYVSIQTALTMATPLPNVLNGGFSVAAWIYPMGSQSNQAALFSFTNPVTGSVLAVSFQSAYLDQPACYLNFTVTDSGSALTNSYTATNYPLATNAWYFFTMVVAYNSLSSNATYTYYLNDISINTFTGPWPQCGSYTNNTIGYGTGMSYFNGLMHDFRVYSRALSSNDVWALWNFGMMTKFYGSASFAVIDPYEMILYTSFDSTLVALPAATAPTVPSTAFLPVTVNNAAFNLPVVPVGKMVSVGAQTANFGWTLASVAGTSFYVVSDVSYGTGYKYGLPGQATQYLGVAFTSAAAASPTAPATVTVSQTVNIQLPSGVSQATYMLSFVAFPLDGSYNAAQTLTVTVGNAQLLNQATFAVSAGTVPYTPFNLPFVVGASGNYPVQLTVSSRSAVNSILGITAFQVATTSVAGTGFNAVDASGLAMYFPFSATQGTNTNNVFYDYATYTGGLGVPRAMLCQNGVTVSALPLPSGRQLTGNSTTITGLTGGNAYANGSYNVSYSRYSSPSGPQLFNGRIQILRGYLRKPIIRFLPPIQNFIRVVRVPWSRGWSSWATGFKYNCLIRYN